MKKLIVANWKLNPDSPREAKELVGKVKRTLATQKKVNAVICPPAIFLSLLAATKPPKNLAFGGQDAFWQKEGAWTGQVGPSMVRKSGADYLILGHSEKRTTGDSDAMINQKLKLALSEDLKVILCVGEKERDTQGEYLQVVRGQLLDALDRVPKKFAPQIIIAYEPIWAIGEMAKGSDTPQGFLEQALFIRKVLSQWADHSSALKIPVLYGGSVDPKNARSFLAEGQADGLLVGRASLRADQFSEILKLANELS